MPKLTTGSNYLGRTDGRTHPKCRKTLFLKSLYIREFPFDMMGVIGMKNVELWRYNGGNAATAENRHHSPSFFSPFLTELDILGRYLLTQIIFLLYISFGRYLTPQFEFRIEFDKIRNWRYIDARYSILNKSFLLFH